MKAKHQHYCQADIVLLIGPLVGSPTTSGWLKCNSVPAFQEISDTLSSKAFTNSYLAEKVIRCLLKGRIANFLVFLFEEHLGKLNQCFCSSFSPGISVASAINFLLKFLFTLFVSREKRKEYNNKKRTLKPLSEISSKMVKLIYHLT